MKTINKLSSVLEIISTMNEEEINRVTEFIQHRDDVLKVHKAFIAVEKFIAEMDDITDGCELAYIFIPTNVWMANNYVTDKKINNEHGKYFAIRSDFIEGTVDNEGTPILRVIDREKEEE